MKYLFLLSCLFFISFAHSDQKLEEKKIDYLLNQVEHFEGVFIRNGEEHPPKKARNHLEFKMNQARKMFWFFGPSSEMTAKNFIDKIASESSSSGKIYKIKHKNGKVQTTKEWLQEKLEKFNPSKKDQ